MQELLVQQVYGDSIKGEIPYSAVMLYFKKTEELKQPQLFAADVIRYQILPLVFKLKGFSLIRRIKMRCFISIELDPMTKQIIEDFIRKDNMEKLFREMKWVKPSNLHITLAFLGEISSNKILSVQKMLTDISKKHTSFSIKFSGLGFFPNLKNPRVFWIGIKEQPELWRLKNAIDRGLDILNISYDKKPFSPHLTIGRLKSRTKIESEKLEQVDFKTSFLVKEIHLMKSELSSSGPTYMSLHRALFRNCV